KTLRSEGVEVEEICKLQEGRPNLIDYMKNGDVDLVINTPSGKGARTDEGKIRAAAVMNRVTCITTLAAAEAAVEACKALRRGGLAVEALQGGVAWGWRVKPLQEWFAGGLTMARDRKDRSANWILEYHGDSVLRLAKIGAFTSWHSAHSVLSFPKQLPDGLLDVSFPGRSVADPFLVEIETFPQLDTW